MILDNEDVTQLYTDYQNVKNYQLKIGLDKRITDGVNGYEGRHWKEGGKKTRLFLKPVLNFIKLICDNKISAILGTPVEIKYEAEDENINIDEFNSFASYSQKEMDLETYDRRCEKDATIKGTGVMHFYWNGKEERLDCEIISPNNIGFSNPMNHDVEKQKWIIISSREEVDKIKSICDSDIDKDLITPDEAEEVQNKEQEGSSLCTVLTRYFKKEDGEVWCERATKRAVVNKPFSLTPDTTQTLTNLGIETTSEDIKISNAKATLYPIVVLPYIESDSSIYGISEVEGLTPNQMIVNVILFLISLDVQNSAWGKYTVAPDALREQKITTEPGQVLIDYTKTMNGIRKITEPAMQTMPLQFVEALCSLTRTIAGANDVIVGEPIGANTSGSAIAQLQAQALKPIEFLRENFMKMKERQGKILLQFFKLNYAFKEYIHEFKDQNTGKSAKITKVFNSIDYTDYKFNVIVETVGGTKSSVAGDVNVLDLLYNKGSISIETYIKAYPESALSNKKQLLKFIEEEKQDKIVTLQQQIAQYEDALKNMQNKLGQAVKVIQKQQATVGNAEALIQQNAKLKEDLVNLYSEATQKIGFANQQITANNKKLIETTNDATNFASIINNSLDKTSHGIAEKSK